MTEHDEARHDAAEQHEEQMHMPPPSIWPITLAAGISILGLGILTNVVFILFGALVAIWALWGWAAEMRHEHA